jgi:predicted TIM-barrel fold metal-dependent hydrolase
LIDEVPAMTVTTDVATLFLPEPEPRPVQYTVISVDDHVVEPRHVFTDHVAARYRDQAPHIVTTPEGEEVWEFGDERIPQIGLSAFAGRRIEDASREPVRFSEMRAGCYDIEARVADMDVNGVWASLNFPSTIAGFCGRVLSSARDRDLGIALTQAWNDWLFEEWYLEHPTRVIPNGLTYITDPLAGAAEIRRNADRGFRAVTLPERPHRIGLPSIFSDYWTPIIEACDETGTVVCLHVGSTGMLDMPEDGPRTSLDAAMFSGMSYWACVEWLFSPHVRDRPNLKVALSEGGIGWVAMLVDRMRKIAPRYAATWPVPPAEVLQRNFWFCTIDDYSAMATRDTIGVENIMVEVDYPHVDGTWPDTQPALARLLEGVPAGEARAICCENAAKLFRHPLPDVVVPADA